MQIPYLILLEVADKGEPIPTEEDILNSLDIPDCYSFLNLTCVASEGEIVGWVNKWANAPTREAT